MYLICFLMNEALRVSAKYTPDRLEAGTCAKRYITGPQVSIGSRRRRLLCPPAVVEQLKVNLEIAAALWIREQRNMQNQVAIAKVDRINVAPVLRIVRPQAGHVIGSVLRDGGAYEKRQNYNGQSSPAQYRR